MTDLTQQEKDFVVEMRQMSSLRDDDDILKDRSSVTDHLRFLVHPGFWAGVLVAVPVIFSALVLLSTYRMSEYLDNESFSWILSQPLDSNLTGLVQQAGFGWFPAYLTFYRWRWILIAGSFVVFLTLAAGLLGVSSWRVARNARNADDPGTVPATGSEISERHEKKDEI